MVDGGSVDVFAQGQTAALRMSAADHALAQLFDGERDAGAIRAAARERFGRALSPEGLEGFAAGLVRHGLLQAGADEPLPVPAHTLEQAHALGWTGDPALIAGAGPAALPPSTVPGSLSAPGLLGGLTGLISGRRGEANRVDIVIDPRPLIAIGRLLIWPLRSRAALLAFGALVIAALVALYQQRLDLLANVDDIFTGYRPLFAALGAALLVNLASASARAAAVARYTPERVRAGVLLGMFGVPRLFVDSAGAAERAGRADRMRIVGASIVGVFALAVLCVFVWFLSMPTRPATAAAAIAVLAVALLMLLFTLNPLPKRDGYFLLAQWLDAPDLREQALFAVFGYERPWFNRARRLPRRALQIYAACMAIYWVAVIAVMFAFSGRWLSEHYGGLGFLVLAVSMGAYMYKQFGKAREPRSTLGWKSDWTLSKRNKWILGGALLLCVLPYRYEPSGEFVVLPQARADVRALVAGDVREVLVKEGDAVRAGDVIARLADDEQRAQVAAGEAKLAQLQADLTLAQRGGKAEEIEVAKQQVATAQKRFEVARATANRLEQAFRRRAVTVQEYERARGAADVAEQELAEAQRALDLVSSPATSDRIAAVEAQVREAEATLAYHRQQLQQTRIAAPIDGRIVSGSLRFAIGNYLNRGELLAVVEDTRQRLVEIKLPETGIGEIAIDKRAYAKAWAYPGTTFRGAVQSIAPVAEEGRYGKVVRVNMAVEDPDDQLKSGMTGNAKVQGDWHLLIVVFTRALTRFLFVEVWSWLP